MKIKKLKRLAKKNGISKKVIDIFSAGHFLKGLFTFFIIYLIMGRMGFSMHDRYYCSLIAVMFLSIIWEILENFVIYSLKLNGIDSLKNSLSDMMFDIVGAIAGFTTVFLINSLV